MVHGGAGDLARLADPAQAPPYLHALRAVLDLGRGLLQAGGHALDVVEACTRVLEDDPLFNAGRGAVLDREGGVALDAGIMDGRDLRLGAVAAVRRIANPVSLARKVLESGSHVFLVAGGALRFARELGMAEVAEHELVTPERQAEHRRVCAGAEPAEQGTVGCVARDRHGHLAAATSTGGLVCKGPGRVGDSPVAGAGVWADDETCAVSCSGRGEDLLRVGLARTAAHALMHGGMDPGVAVQVAVDHLRRRVAGAGGLILIDRGGRCACAYTTPRMLRGWIEHGGEVVCRI
jgi:beta-aspartyl-peptidase (threonine type)